MFFDWVYLNNFDELCEFWVIELLLGSVIEFSVDIDCLIDNLMLIFLVVFEYLVYQQKKNVVDCVFNQCYDCVLDLVEWCVLEKDVVLYCDSVNVVFILMKDGKVFDEVEFVQLFEVECECFYKDIVVFEEYFNEELVSLLQWKCELSN